MSHRTTDAVKQTMMASSLYTRVSMIESYADWSSKSTVGIVFVLCSEKYSDSYSFFVRCTWFCTCTPCTTLR